MVERFGKGWWSEPTQRSQVGGCFVRAICRSGWLTRLCDFCQEVETLKLNGFLSTLGRQLRTWNRHLSNWDGHLRDLKWLPQKRAAPASGANEHDQIDKDLARQLYSANIMPYVHNISIGYG